MKKVIEAEKSLVYKLVGWDSIEKKQALEKAISQLN